jgi:hypothetical protein
MTHLGDHVIEVSLLTKGFIGNRAQNLRKRDKHQYQRNQDLIKRNENEKLMKQKQYRFVGYGALQGNCRKLLYLELIQVRE